MKKFGKISVIVILSLAFIVMVPPIFMARSYTASSSIVIQSSQYNVFPYFADLRNWEKWSPWKEKDSAAKYTYSENTMGAGSTMEWNSKKSGTGKMTTVQFKKFHHINYQWDFVKPFRSTSGGQFMVEKLNDKEVKVTWTNTGKLKWPLDRWFNTFVNFKKMLEKDFAKGLNKLKTVVESSPQKTLPVVIPEKMELKDQYILSMMYLAVRNEQISQYIGESYGTILKTINRTGTVQLEQPPLCLYYSHNKVTTKMRPGLVVATCPNLQGDVECFPIKGGRVLRFSYLGGYNNMEPTYDAIDMYLQENKINKRENYTWESYISDPGTEPDSTKWLTYIYVPVM